MTIILSNCTYNGSAFLRDEDLFNLEKSLRDTLLSIYGLEYRGVGCSMVRGTTVNSLTLGVSAGYYFNNQKLSYNNASDLRTAIKSKLSGLPLAYSELRVEVSYLGMENV